MNGREFFVGGHQNTIILVTTSRSARFGGKIRLADCADIPLMSGFVLHRASRRLQLIWIYNTITKRCAPSGPANLYFQYSAIIFLFPYVPRRSERYFLPRRPLPWANSHYDFRDTQILPPQRSSSLWKLLAEIRQFAAPDQTG